MFELFIALPQACFVGAETCGFLRLWRREGDWLADYLRTSRDVAASDRHLCAGL